MSCNNRILNLLLFFFKGHFLSPDTCLVREAARCLANMAALFDNHPPILSGGGLKAFKTGSKNIDAMTARFSSLGLVNLSSQCNLYKRLQYF